MSKRVDRSISPIMVTSGTPAVDISAAARAPLRIFQMVVRPRDTVMRMSTPKPRASLMLSFWDFMGMSDIQEGSYHQFVGLFLRSIWCVLFLLRGLFYRRE